MKVVMSRGRGCAPGAFHRPAPETIDLGQARGGRSLNGEHLIGQIGVVIDEVAQLV